MVVTLNVAAPVSALPGGPAGGSPGIISYEPPRVSAWGGGLLDDFKEEIEAKRNKFVLGAYPVRGPARRRSWVALTPVPCAFSS